MVGSLPNVKDVNIRTILVYIHTYIYTHMSTPCLDIGLCGEVVCLVLEIERVEPLKLCKVEAKMQVCIALD